MEYKMVVYPITGVPLGWSTSQDKTKGIESISSCVNSILGEIARQKGGNLANGHIHSYNLAFLGDDAILSILLESDPNKPTSRQ